MGRKKIDDNILIEMIESGESRTNISKFFHCSPAAICKRLKRLAPPPESFRQLTMTQQKFIIEKVKGNTATQAVMNSYEVSSRESARALGSELMRKPEIQQSIQDLMSLHGVDLSHRIKRLADHIDNRDPNVSLKALDCSFKIGREYALENAGGNTQIFGKIIVNQFHNPVQIVNKSDEND